MSQDLLLENQYEYFIELIKDIVRQLKLNPNQLPTPQAPRRNLDKVCSFTIQTLLIYIHRLETNPKLNGIQWQQIIHMIDNKFLVWGDNEYLNLIIRKYRSPKYKYFN